MPLKHQNLRKCVSVSPSPGKNARKGGTGFSLLRRPLESWVKEYELTVELSPTWKAALFGERPVKEPSMEWQNVSPNWKMMVSSPKKEERPISRGRLLPDALESVKASLFQHRMEQGTYSHASTPLGSVESTLEARQLVVPEGRGCVCFDRDFQIVRWRTLFMIPCAGTI